MLRTKLRLTLLPLLLASTFAFAQTAPTGRIVLSHEPAPNLGKLKTTLSAYHDCSRPDCYVPELNRQTDRAIAILNKRVAAKKPGEKLALVLDIDETALSNWTEETQDDYGYISKDWNAWVDTAKAPAIEGTLRLFNAAKAKGVAIFFITGRSQDQEAATTQNLNSVGYQDWTGLALRGPHSPDQTTTLFKSGERQKIVDAGYHLILNVGDQISDLNGTPQAEVSVKLPNPFYYIP